MFQSKDVNSWKTFAEPTSVQIFRLPYKKHNTLWYICHNNIQKCIFFGIRNVLLKDPSKIDGAHKQSTGIFNGPGQSMELQKLSKYQIILRTLR